VADGGCLCEFSEVTSFRNEAAGPKSLIVARTRPTTQSPWGLGIAEQPVVLDSRMMLCIYIERVSII
jgi:hypothetical protein